MGPFKSGKTYLAMEFAVIGMLSGLKVAFFSLEMMKFDMYERIFKRLTATSDSGRILNPIFDCAKNQQDLCQFPRRNNDRVLDWQPGEPIDMRKNERYRVCTFCRDHANFIHHYEPATWFERSRGKKFDQQSIIDAKDTFELYYKGKFRFKSYPRFSANIDDIKRDLQILEVTEGWVPDIIVVDYADILKAESGSPQEGFEKEDRSWMALSQLGGEKRALVISPTQVTTDGLDAFLLKAKHAARWRGKLGHVDGMITINRTEEEKRMGVMRVAWLEHRHQKFFETDCCTVLQNFDTSQVHLDSIHINQSNDGEHQ